MRRRASGVQNNKDSFKGWIGVSLSDPFWHNPTAQLIMSSLSLLSPKQLQPHLLPNIQPRPNSDYKPGDLVSRIPHSIVKDIFISHPRKKRKSVWNSRTPFFLQQRPPIWQLKRGPASVKQEGTRDNDPRKLNNHWTGLHHLKYANQQTHTHTHCLPSHLRL